MELLRVAGIAFLAEGGGLLVGILLFYIFNVTNKRIIGMLFGGTSGLMIAIICFDVLPKAMERNRIDLLLIGVGIGVCLGLMLDDITPGLERLIHIKSSRMIRAGLALVVGIAIHNIPEGFALGALISATTEKIFQFVFILALHSVPEGIALAIPFKQAHLDLKKVLLIPIFLGCVMGIGGMLGYILSTTSENFVSIALGLAAGIILYIVCEELIPESRKEWNGRMTTVATIVGIIMGLLLLM